MEPRFKEFLQMNPELCITKAINPSERVIPYTSEMDAEYQKQYGKSLLTGLPPVFFEVLSTTPEFRMNFWHLASQLYANAFYKQIGKWCKEHHIAFMGHVANEGNLFNQIRDQINYFRNAQYMSFGCCDQLGSIFRAEFEKKYTCSLIAIIW